MVGSVGCGCCETSGQTRICTSSIFKNEIIEDFSPTFDPYFSGVTGGVQALQTVNNACQCIGTEYTVNARSTRGYEYGGFKKTTLEEPVEVFLKLVLWDDEIYQGSPQPFLHETLAKVHVDITGVQQNPALLVSNYEFGPRAYFYNSTGYNIKVGSFRTRLTIRPKAGDVFGIRLSDFAVQQQNSTVVYLKPQKAEFILNNLVKYTVTDSQYFTTLNACYFQTGFFLTEPYFVYPWGQVVTNRLRVDDFTHSSL